MGSIGLKQDFLTFHTFWLPEPYRNLCFLQQTPYTEHGAWTDKHSPISSVVPMVWHRTSDSPRQPSTWELQDPVCPSTGTPAGE